MSTHNIRFYKKCMKIIPKLSPNTYRQSSAPGSVFAIALRT